MPSLAGQSSVRIRISGDVQGVGFRAWTERRAIALGLFGWVRNREDGDVEAVFSGPLEKVEAMLAACREGPRHARVTTVEILGEGEADLRSFTVRY